MKLAKMLAFVSALIALAPVAAFAQGAAGTWDLTVDAPQGAQTVQVALRETAGKLVGTLSSPLGSVDIDGTTDGTDTVVNAKIDAQGMQIVLTFHGKVAGDTFNGNVQLGDFGEAPFTGKRSAAQTARSVSDAPTTAAAATSSVAGDATGKWDITLSLAGAGDFPMTATFTQAGANVTGTLSSQAGEIPVNGTMTGNVLSMKFTAQTPAGDIPVTMTGTLLDATFTGKASIEGLGEADWTGKRAN